MLLRKLREQVESEVGSSDVDEMSPAVLRWLLLSFLPNYPIQSIGPDVYREMRVAAEALDGLPRGNVVYVTDMRSQRFVAQSLVVRDGSWDVAKWLELIQVDPRPAALADHEEEIVRRLEAGDLKLRDLARKVKST